MPDATPLHELTEEELTLLSPRIWDGEAEYQRLATTVLPPPPGSTWFSSSSLQVDFPITLPAYRRQLLTTLLMQYTLYRQKTTMCGVPNLEDHPDDDMVFVTKSTQIKKRRFERRDKDAEPDDPWETHSTKEWENIREAVPGGFHHKYTAFNVETSYPACSIEESQPDPPEGWDGEDLTDEPDYEDYDWRIIDEEDELSDDAIISYSEMIGGCLGALRDQLQSKQWTRSFTMRKAYPLMSYGIPLQGWAGAEDLSARVDGGEAAVHKWTADLWATGQRIPFKIVYTERITWVYSNPSHEAGEEFSVEEKTITFSHSEGWHHELSPPCLVGRKTALENPHIEFFAPE